jgi:imidazole glycerol phosphate synthase subunit HisF
MVELEGRTTVECKEAHCISRSIIELISRKLGITTNVEEHVKKLVELVETGDIYFTSFTMNDVEITIRDIYYDWDADECDYLDNCAGIVMVRFVVNGGVDKMRQIVMKLLKDIGADKYVKCE